MWRNYLAAAVRNLARNRLHSAITTLSLAIGFTGLILAALYWRYEHSYDRFWPNADRVVMIGEFVIGDRVSPTDAIDPGLALRLRQEAPEALEIARTIAATFNLEHGAVKAPESNILWADPNLFAVLRPKVVLGDLDDALKAPNSILLTRGLARKYFGDADPVGQVMTLSSDIDENIYGRAIGPASSALLVTAVIEDIPPDSHLRAGAFISGLTSGSPLASSQEEYQRGAHTYLLLRSAAERPALQRRLDDIARRHYAAGPSRATHSEFRIQPIEQVYAKPASYFPLGARKRSTGGMDRTLMTLIGLIAGVLMAVAAINFITLMTARGAGRALEVGVRKAVGASRNDLTAQFVGEAVLYAALAFVLGLAGAELALSVIKAAFGLAMGFDYLRNAGLISLLLVVALAIGALAGLYPALALSAFRPGPVLKGGPMKLPGSTRLRHGLISIQFIPLIGLSLLIMSLDQTTRRDVAEEMALLDPRALLISEACTPQLKAGIAALPGVIQAACMPAAGGILEGGVRYPAVGKSESARIKNQGGKISTQNGHVPLNHARVDFGALEFHRMKPLAGWVFAFDHPGDDDGAVITEAARKKLGFASAQAAVGQSFIRDTDESTRSVRIIGVVNDRPGAPAEAFVLDPIAAGGGLGVRLAPADQEAALAAIDRLWAASGKTQPMRRQFYGDLVRANVAEAMQMIQLATLYMLVGLFVAVIGLFGLSAFLAEQRTKEIGVRKALGASRLQVLRRLLVQFAWPVILANLIACPAFLAVMSYLQRGYPVSGRTPLGPEVFVPVIAGSMLIAFIAVFSHAWQVSGQRPVKALRYE